MGPRVLMYNLLEIKLILYIFCRQITLYCIVLTNCGNKSFQCFQLGIGVGLGWQGNECADSGTDNGSKVINALIQEVATIAI